MLNHASVCSGVGMAELAAFWCGWNNVFSAEINPFCHRVLTKRFPNTKHHGSFTDDAFQQYARRQYRGRVDVLTAGLPCQPFSDAGQKAGTSDERYLGPAFVRLCTNVKPTWAIVENVPGFLTMAYEEFNTAMEQAGYKSVPFILPASLIGADHERKRLYAVFYNATYANRIRRRKQRERANGENQKARYQSEGESFPTSDTVIRRGISTGTRSDFGQLPGENAGSDSNGNAPDTNGATAGTPGLSTGRQKRQSNNQPERSLVSSRNGETDSEIHSGGDRQNTDVRTAPDANSKRKQQQKGVKQNQRGRVGDGSTGGNDSNTYKVNGNPGRHAGCQPEQQKPKKNARGERVANSNAPGLQRSELTGTFSKGTRPPRSTTERAGFDGWSEPWIEVITRICGMDDGDAAGLERSESGRRFLEYKPTGRFITKRLQAVGNALVPQLMYDFLD